MSASVIPFLTPFASLIGSFLGMLLVIAFIGAFAVSLWFLKFQKAIYAKIIRITAKHFYIANILLDFVLIATIQSIKTYGLNNDWVQLLSLLLFLLVFGVLFNILLWFCYFLLNLKNEIIEKLIDLKINLKYKIQWLHWKFSWAWISLKCKIIMFFRRP